MTDAQLQRRYNIITKLMGDRRNDYTINLDDTYIRIRNTSTLEGIRTDSLQSAKKWIKKDMEENQNVSI